MFAYKAAVAVRKAGFTNIKIYNGGIKDWRKNGYPLAIQAPLPDYDSPFISTDDLYKSLAKAEESSCRIEGTSAVTIVDFRTQSTLNPAQKIPAVKTSCPTIRIFLDELQDSATRVRIPKQGLVVTITETGNRDEIAMRYLSAFGFTNIKGLKFGMRGWLKAQHPVTLDY